MRCAGEPVFQVPPQVADAKLWYNGKCMKLHNKTYDVVIPFGRTCAAAMYSIERGFRRCSLPFDWVGTPNIGMLVEFILNGFADFMVPERLEYMEPLKGFPPDIHHDYYRDPTNQFLTFHDFRKGIPMAEERVVVKERYDRRIKRLYEILESPTKKLLFRWAYDDLPSTETLIESVTALRNRFSQGEIDLLFMNSVKDFKGIEMISVAPGITLARGYFHNVAKHITTGDCELTNRILKRVSVRGAWRERLFREAARNRMLFKLWPALVLNREKRRRLREEIRSRYGMDRMLTRFFGA